ncbi:phospholipase C [Bacillus arachidis]|uniref:phospholipase C n=1 Tax=Bacillus arachidis TaxID=2819290 RepID=UPI00255CF74D|nr:phospholipase C [Bacillus arachidis]WIY62214.1 phospholipase C [Bacillus arachidis]
MKRKILALASVIALTAPIQSVAFAHENCHQDPPIALKWSAESIHNEGVSSHLWIVNRAIDIMSQNTTVVKQNETALLNEWRTDLEKGIYSADYENPYYDNSTFASHFYDPDSGKTYIPFAKQAKQTGAKYFKLAGEAYQNKDLKNAFFYLGLSLHYLGDVNQPMHAANFTNISHPFGFHSKYENFVDTVKDNYRVTDGNGYWNWKSVNPEEWVHASATAAKADFPSIVNSNTKNWFLKAAVSQDSADKWRAEVTPVTGKRLIEAQRITAGYIHLWFDTYVNNK